jgi:protein-L-isoaspartate(D-aspartate) O-methyltransferase
VPVEGGYATSESPDPTWLYQDVLIGLIPGKRLNSGQPTLHAKALGEAAIQEGEHVVHVGAGTGYYTAILSYLVGHPGWVDAYEIESTLVAQAIRNLRQYHNVTVHADSGVDADLPAVDVIDVSAAVTDLVTSWLDALTNGPPRRAADANTRPRCDVADHQARSAAIRGRRLVAGGIHPLRRWQ